MKSDQFVRKIRIYAVISFLLPLIVINLCLLTFKFLGDFDTYPDPFTVTDQMRIITVYQPDPYVDANGKQGDSLWNRAGYELKDPSNTLLQGDASLNPFGGYHYGSQLYVAPLMNQGVIDSSTFIDRSTFIA